MTAVKTIVQHKDDHYNVTFSFWLFGNSSGSNSRSGYSFSKDHLNQDDYRRENTITIILNLYGGMSEVWLPFFKIRNIKEKKPTLVCLVS